MSGIQYTVRGIPEALDTVLREEAVKYGKSLNTLLIDKLSESCRLTDEPRSNALEKFIGSMVFDEGFEEAMRECSTIHPDEWPEFDLPPLPLQNESRT